VGGPRAAGGDAPGQVRDQVRCQIRSGFGGKARNPAQARL